MDFVEEMRKLDAAAAKQGATAAELVEREIARRDALAADEAAAFDARDERARIHEAPFGDLFERIRDAREGCRRRRRIRVWTSARRERADDDEDPSGRPTLENLESMASEYVDEGFEGLDVNLADVNLGDVARASGAARRALVRW